ncbi:MAG: dihydrodipicolinate synthase family protein [Fimbriimonadaceae bacterium]
MRDLQGLFVPIPTPFTDDGTALSEIRLARLVEFYRNEGALGFVVGTEAGEYTSLSLAERKQLLEWVVRESKGLPVLAHVTAMTTAAATDLCQHAERHGARGAILAPPPLDTFRAHEIASYVHGVQRYGNQTTIFVEGYGPSKETYAELLPLLKDSIRAGWVEKGPIAELRTRRRICSAEMLAHEIVISPLVILGNHRLGRAFREKPEELKAITEVFKEGGVVRAAKSALTTLGVDIGPARAPMGGLAEPLEERLTSTLAALH